VPGTVSAFRKATIDVWNIYHEHRFTSTGWYAHMESCMAKEHQNPSQGSISNQEDNGVALNEPGGEHLAAVGVVAEIIARASDMEELFEDALAALAGLLTADAAAVFVRSERSGEATLRCQMTPGEGVERGLSPDFGSLPRDGAGHDVKQDHIESDTLSPRGRLPKSSSAAPGEGVEGGLSPDFGSLPRDGAGHDVKQDHIESDALPPRGRLPKSSSAAPGEGVERGLSPDFGSLPRDGAGHDVKQNRIESDALPTSGRLPKSSSAAPGEEVATGWWGSLPERVMETGQPMTFSDTTAAMQTAATVPLRSKGQIVGALLVGRRSLRGFRQQDVDVLGVVGAQLGLAVENVRLNERASRQIREQDVLFDVNRAIAATLDLDTLLNLIVRSAQATIVATDAVVMHLLDEKSGALLPRAASFIANIPPKTTGKSDMRKGRGIAGEAIATGKIINVPDVTRDARFTKGTGRVFRALMVAPLMIGDQCIGTLSIDSQVPSAFSVDDEKLLSLLASQAAVAIQNAQLFSESQRLSGDLQKSLKELQQAQTLLIQSEKLSALGELIAGVAHELNNPLTAIMGYAQLLQGTEGASERVERDLLKIRLQAQRAARIVQSLLTFARQHKVEQRCIEVNESIRQVLELREYQLRVNDIRLVTDLAEEPLEVLADPNQLQQVFLNLINNAQDAMVDHHGKGQLTIRSRRVGNVVRVEFADDGPGIAPEHMGRLFAPFFTTKEIGKGTGLGLSICYGIIRQEEGSIWAESEPGQGATFIIELPISSRKAEARVEMEPKQKDEPLVRGHFLVVDDDEEVAELLYRLLSDDGHEVDAELSGQAALGKVEASVEAGLAYDLIICDIKMPGMDGPHLYYEIRRRYPELAERMIFFTGDIVNLETQAFFDRIGNPHVSKPFVGHELREVISEMLEGRVLREEIGT